MAKLFVKWTPDNNLKKKKKKRSNDNWHFTFNTLRPRQNGRRFPDDIFKCIFIDENIWVSIKVSLKFVPKGPINNIPAIGRRSGDKP